MVLKEFEIYRSGNYIYRTNQYGKGYTNYIYANRLYYIDNNSSSTFLSKNAQEATEFEKAWLKTCIEAGIFVPKNKVKFEIIHEIW